MPTIARNPTRKKKAVAQRLSQEERRAASNERLLAAGLKLISERGSGGMSLADVGLAAGYSRGLPGERFGSKLGLLEAIVKFLQEWIDARISAAIANKSGLEAVLARIECHVQAAEENPEFHRALYHLVIESTWTEPDLRASISKLERSHRHGFIKLLKEGQERGEIKATLDLTQQAIIIVGTMRGVIIQALVAGTPGMLSKMKGDLVQMFRLTLKS